MKIVITLAFISFLAINLYAINVEKMPRTIVQPDGTKIECFITGDEFSPLIPGQTYYYLDITKIETLSTNH